MFPLIKKSFFCCLFSALFIAPAMLFSQTQPPAPFAPQTVKAFADALFADGFFSEAESEYKRYLFSEDGAKKEADVHAVLSLATIYHAQNNRDGISWLKHTFGASAPRGVQEKINLVYGKMLFLERDQSAYAAFYDTLTSDAAEQTESAEQNAWSLDFTHITALSLQLLAQDMTAATQTALVAAETNAVFNPVADLCTAYKPKSAALAVFLSCLVPGLGKWYGDTFGGFVTDFLAVGSFTAGAIYTGIDTHWKNWRPYVFGSVAATLFVVDLYGTYKNIKRYNAAQLRNIYEETDKVYGALY